MLNAYRNPRMTSKFEAKYNCCGYKNVLDYCCFRKIGDYIQYKSKDVFIDILDVLDEYDNPAPISVDSDWEESNYTDYADYDDVSSYEKSYTSNTGQPSDIDSYQYNNDKNIRKESSNMSSPEVDDSRDKQLKIEINDGVNWTETDKYNNENEYDTCNKMQEYNMNLARV